MRTKWYLAALLGGATGFANAACLNGAVGAVSGDIEQVFCQGSCRWLALEIAEPAPLYRFRHQGATLNGCELTLTAASEVLFVDGFQAFSDPVAFFGYDGAETWQLDSTQPQPLRVDANGNVTLYLSDALQPKPYAPPACINDTVFELASETPGVNFYPSEICQADANGQPLLRNSFELRVAPQHGTLEEIYQGYRYIPPESMQGLAFDELLFRMRSLDGQDSNIARIRLNFPQ